MLEATLTTQDKWDVIGNYFENNGDACEGCPHFAKAFYPETYNGWEHSCELLQSDYGDPEECLGFNYMLECLEDEEEELKDV